MQASTAFGGFNPSANPFQPAPVNPFQPAPVNPFNRPPQPAMGANSTAASPFNPFNTPTQSAFTPASTPASPFSVDAAKQAPVNPFLNTKPAAVNPFLGAAQSNPSSFSVAPEQGATTNGFSAFGNKPVFGIAPNAPTAPNPFQKAAAAASKPTANGTISKAARQARFNETTDVSTQYQQAVEERVVRRAKLIKDGIIDDPERPKPLEEAITFTGTCTQMCPEFECLQRQHQKMVDSFELDEEGNPSEQLFVKSFHRPAAGMDAPLPEDVRTPRALVDTLRYLVFDVVRNSSWLDCHGFIRDRTRSIRQDFTYQNYEGDEAVICTEIIARFHILALHELCEAPDNQEFMELEQLDKSLTTLGFLYRDGLRPNKDGYRKAFPNEAEFRAYTILRHLRDRYVEREDLRTWPVEVLYSPKVQHALKIYQVLQRYDKGSSYGFHAQHYINTFFDLVKSPHTDYVMACLLQVYFPEIRRHALKMIAGTYMKTSKQTSLEWITEYLCYESMEDAERDILHYGLSVREHVTETGRFYYLVPERKTFNDEAAKIRTHPHPSILNPKKQAGSSLVDYLWGREEPIQLVPVTSIKNEQAMLQGICQEVDSECAFGEIDSFFNIPGADAGAVPNWTPKTLPSGPQFANFNKSVSPFTPPVQAQNPFAATNNGFPSSNQHFPAPPAPSVFATNNSFSGFSQPATQQPASVFARAPAFAAHSAENPFAPAALASMPSMAPPTGLTNGNSLFSVKPQVSAFFPVQPVDNKPLFPVSANDGEDDDYEEEEDDTVPDPQLPSWTSFLPSGVASHANPSASLAFGAKPANTNDAPSLFDKKPGASLPSFSFSKPALQQAGAATTFAPQPTLENIGGDTSSNLLAKAEEDKTNKELEEKQAREMALAREAVLKERMMAKAAKDKAEKEEREKREKEEAIERERRENEEAEARELKKREEELEAKAMGFYNRRILEKFYYQYAEKARKHRRRTLQALRKKHRAAYAEDPQWWPIVKDGALYTDSVQKVSELVFKSAELETSIPQIVHMAFAESNVDRTTYRMLLHNNDRTGRSEYWFHQKFLNGSPRISVFNHDTKNEFHAQLTVTEIEAPEVGFLLFGCSADFAVSNKDRFATDCDNLHHIVNYLTQRSRFARLAVMVVCYRSPMDDEPAHPTGLDSSRTLGKARRERIEAVKSALNFSSFPRTVIGKKVVMVETLRDLDLSYEVRTFADEYILDTISAQYSPSPEPSPPAPALQAQRQQKQQQPARKRRQEDQAQREGSPKQHRLSPPAERRKRSILEVDPRTPVKQQSPATATSSTTKRGSESGKQDTPLKRYRRKQEEQAALDNARLKSNNLIGFQGFSVMVQGSKSQNADSTSRLSGLPAQRQTQHQSPVRTLVPHSATTSRLPAQIQARQQPMQALVPRAATAPKQSTPAMDEERRKRIDQTIADAFETSAAIMKMFEECGDDSFSGKVGRG